MFRTIGRTLTILTVAIILAGISYFLIEALGGQAVAAGMQQGFGHGDHGASIGAGLVQVGGNLAQVAIVIAIVYPLQRKWLARRQTRLAQTRRAVAAAR